MGEQASVGGVARLSAPSGALHTDPVRLSTSQLLYTWAMVSSGSHEECSALFREHESRSTTFESWDTTRLGVVEALRQEVGPVLLRWLGVTRLGLEACTPRSGAGGGEGESVRTQRAGISRRSPRPPHRAP